MKKIITLLMMVSSVAAQAQSWDGTNNPANLNKDYNYAFDQLPLSATIEAAKMPWIG
jgi:hypothetical protein